MDENVLGAQWIKNLFVARQDVPREKDAALKLIEEIKAGKFMPYISQVTLDEIIETPDDKRRQRLIKLVDEIGPEELPLAEEAVLLANRYIESKILPDKERNDALRIAIATVHNLDLILSWNFEHMVKLKTRQQVPAINTLMGYKPIEICSPLEVIEP